MVYEDKTVNQRFWKNQKLSKLGFASYLGCWNLG